MKKKILFVSIIVALLMVSMPFVSTLQATYVQPQSTSVTKTITIDNVEFNQQEVISLLQVAKLTCVTPADKAFCQQLISAVYINGVNWDCLLALGVFSFLAGLALGIGGMALWNTLYKYFVNDEGNVDIETILNQLINSGKLGFAALQMWPVIKDYCNIGVAYTQTSQTLSLQTSSVLVPTAQTSTCPLCAQ